MTSTGYSPTCASQIVTVATFVIAVILVFSVAIILASIILAAIAQATMTSAWAFITLSLWVLWVHAISTGPCKQEELSNLNLSNGLIVQFTKYYSCQIFCFLQFELNPEKWIKMTY